jgi:hypothetical protein
MFLAGGILCFLCFSFICCDGFMDGRFLDPVFHVFCLCLSPFLFYYADIWFPFSSER